MMKKAEKTELIKNAFTDKVKHALKASEIGDFDIDPSTDHSAQKLDDTILWINEFIEGEVKEFLSVYNLRTPDIWKHYKVLGLTDLVEIKMLREVKKKINEKWKKRPSVIRRTYGEG